MDRLYAAQLSVLPSRSRFDFSNTNYNYDNSNTNVSVHLSFFQWHKPCQYGKK